MIGEPMEWVICVSLNRDSVLLKKLSKDIQGSRLGLEESLPSKHAALSAKMFLSSGIPFVFYQSNGSRFSLILRAVCFPVRPRQY